MCKLCFPLFSLCIMNTVTQSFSQMFYWHKPELRFFKKLLFFSFLALSNYVLKHLAGERIFPASAQTISDFTLHQNTFYLQSFTVAYVHTSYTTHTHTHTHTQVRLDTEVSTVKHSTLTGNRHHSPRMDIYLKFLFADLDILAIKA
jgi:hypothetical protein